MNTIKLNTIGEAPIKVATGGGENYVYYSGTIRDFAEGISLSSIIKANIDNEIFFIPTGYFLGSDYDLNNIIGAGYDLSMKINPFESQEMFTIGEFIAEYSKEWTQITEEEFYDTTL